MGIEVGGEMQAKGIENIFNKNTNRKLPKSWERNVYPGTRGIRTPEKTLHVIL
jgi:hypothetical protein